MQLPAHAMRLSESEYDTFVSKSGMTPQKIGDPNQLPDYHNMLACFEEDISEAIENEPLKPWIDLEDIILNTKSETSFILSLPKRWQDVAGSSYQGLFSMTLAHNTLQNPEPVESKHPPLLLFSGAQASGYTCTFCDPLSDLWVPGALITKLTIKHPTEGCIGNVRICPLPNPNLQQITVVNMTLAPTGDLPEIWESILQQVSSNKTLIIMLTNEPNQLKSSLDFAKTPFHLIMSPESFGAISDTVFENMELCLMHVFDEASTREMEAERQKEIQRLSLMINQPSDGTAATIDQLKASLSTQENIKLQLDGSTVFKGKQFSSINLNRKLTKATADE